MIHDWISIDEYVYREAERKQSSTVIHGTNGRIEINGTPIGTVTKWSIDYDPAERGKSMKNKHRINALEREVKLLMGTVEQLREQQRSNSSAVRSAIVSIADHNREHVEGKAHQDTLITPEQREVRNQIMSLRTLINELRAEMQKSDRDLGEIITNNRNHAILDKRHAEQQLAAVQVQLAGLKEWAELTDASEREQSQRLATLERAELDMIEKHIEPLAKEHAHLSGRIANMRCNVSTAQYDDMLSKIATLESALADLQVDRARASATREAAQESITSAGALAVKTYYTVEQLREQLDTLRTQVDTSTVWVRLEHVEQMLATQNTSPGKQLYQIDEATGQYVAVEPPVWYGELPALLQSLRSEIDALLDRTNGRVSQTREYVEQLRDRVEQLRSQTSANLQSLSDSIATNTREIENIQPRLHSHHIGA